MHRDPADPVVPAAAGDADLPEFPRAAGDAGCVLISGFEPFGGEPQNPSWEIVRALHGRRLGAHPVRGLRLPCRFGEAPRLLLEAVARHRPVLVLAIGQAGGRAEMGLERVAINLDDARIPDNAGLQPLDRPVVAGGPAAYFSTLAVKAGVAALREAGLPAAVSHTAGTFVCNHVFYALQHALAGSGVASGFLHVPWMASQAPRHPGQPWLPLEAMVEGVARLLPVLLAHRGGDAGPAAGSSAGTLH
jgi:pyroglutamyl-peptidase